jgi:hypothetical protein
MLIPGVPDEDLERLHWNHGGGRGAAGYRHVPSGITVARECLPDVPTRLFYEEALAELEQELRERGLLSKNGETRGDAGAAPDGARLKWLQDSTSNRSC